MARHEVSFRLDMSLTNYCIADIKGTTIQHECCVGTSWEEVQERANKKIADTVAREAALLASQPADYVVE